MRKGSSPSCCVERAHRMARAASAPYITVRLKGRSGSSQASRGVRPIALQYFHSTLAISRPASSRTKKGRLGGPSHIAAALQDRDRQLGEISIAQLASIERQSMVG